MPAELTEQQKKNIETLRGVVGPIVAEAVDERMKRFAEEFKGAGTNRMARLLNGTEDRDDSVRIHAGTEGSDLPPPPNGYKAGMDAARFIRAIAGSKGDPQGAFDLATKWWGKDARATQAVHKAALAAQQGAAGGFLLPEELAAEVIEFLRPASAIRQLNPVVMPMDVGTLRVPKLATGSSATYVGENVNVATAQPVFGQVVLSAKKLAALVPISNDLVRRGGPNVDTLIRDDLVAAIAQRSDLAFIRGDGTASQPKGLLNWVLSAENIVSNVTVNTANTIADLGKIIQALADANVRFIRPGWVMSNRTWRFLYTLISTTNQFIFRDEMNNGTIFGFPFAKTSQIPNNLAPGTGSELYFVDFADVVIGETTGILIDVSTEAAYFDGSAVQPTFSLDQMVIRAIVEHDFAMRHNESVALLSQVLWN